MRVICGNVQGGEEVGGNMGKGEGVKKRQMRLAHAALYKKRLFVAAI